jgi:hypothetical protein
MAWGQRGSQGVDDLVQRIRQNDPKLTSLTLLRQRKCGDEVGVHAVHGCMLLPACWAAHAACRHDITAMPLHAPYMPHGALSEPSHSPMQEVQQLADALSKNTVLQELFLSSHAISPAAAGMLSGMLRSNASIASICIGDSGFGDAGQAALSPGLGASTSLTAVDAERKVCYE